MLAVEFQLQAGLWLPGAARSPELRVVACHGPPPWLSETLMLADEFLAGDERDTEVGCSSSFLVAPSLLTSVWMLAHGSPPWLSERLPPADDLLAQDEREAAEGVPSARDDLMGDG